MTPRTHFFQKRKTLFQSFPDYFPRLHMFISHENAWLCMVTGPVYMYMCHMAWTGRGFVLVTWS